VIYLPPRRALLGVAVVTNRQQNGRNVPGFEAARCAAVGALAQGKAACAAFDDEISF